MESKIRCTVLQFVTVNEHRNEELTEGKAVERADKLVTWFT